MGSENEPSEKGCRRPLKTNQRPLQRGRYGTDHTPTSEADSTVVEGFQAFVTASVANRGDGVIAGVLLATGQVSTIKGSDGTSAGRELSEPTGVALDGAGNLYVSEYGGQTIRKTVLAPGRALPACTLSTV